MLYPLSYGREASDVNSTAAVQRNKPARPRGMPLPILGRNSRHRGWTGGAMALTSEDIRG